MSKAVSMRLSDEVIAIIEQTPGNKFTDKFNNLVLQLDLEFARKTKALEVLNSRIDEQQTKYSIIKNYLDKIRSCSY